MVGYAAERFAGVREHTVPKLSAAAAVVTESLSVIATAGRRHWRIVEIRRVANSAKNVIYAYSVKLFGFLSSCLREDVQLITNSAPSRRYSQRLGDFQHARPARPRMTA
jgi:hypothetical protein